MLWSLQDLDKCRIELLSLKRLSTQAILRVYD